MAEAIARMKMKTVVTLSMMLVSLLMTCPGLSSMERSGSVAYYRSCLAQIEMTGVGSEFIQTIVAQDVLQGILKSGIWVTVNLILFRGSAVGRFEKPSKLI